MEKIIDMIDTEHTIEHSQVSQSRIERVGNMAHVYKPEGTYTLVYGDSHGFTLVE